MGRRKQRGADRRLEVTGAVIVPPEVRAWERDLIFERLRKALEDQLAAGRIEPCGGRYGT